MTENNANCIPNFSGKSLLSHKNSYTFFYKKPFYKKLALKCQNVKKLLVLFQIPKIELRNFMRGFVTLQGKKLKFETWNL